MTKENIKYVIQSKGGNSVKVIIIEKQILGFIHVKISKINIIITTMVIGTSRLTVVIYLIPTISTSYCLLPMLYIHSPHLSYIFYESITV